MRSTLSKDKSDISKMFDSIAPKYDFLNHFLSMGIDKSWRRKLIRKVKESGAKYALDLACGTGDITYGLYRCNIDALGMDISQKMLEIAKKRYQRDIKSERPGLFDFTFGAADEITQDDNEYDAVTISFGIRNFDNREKCIEEIYRVLKPGGMVAILEFTIPEKRIWKFIYTTYFKKVLPTIGKIVSKNKAAYTYLPISAFEFPQREVFCKELTKGGFKNVHFTEMTGGVACLYIGTK